MAFLELSDGFHWVRALHLMSVISWMAGLLYLPRLYVYHTQTQVGSEASEMLKIMERRLLRAIMMPAMIATWLFGLWMLPNIWDPSAGWLHTKLAAVVLLTLTHFWLAKHRIDFAKDANDKPEKYYRALNEVPTVLMIVIVIMAVVEPF